MVKVGEQVLLLNKRSFLNGFLKFHTMQMKLGESLDDLDKWPEKVKVMQKNWIGKSEGCEIVFKLEKMMMR